MFKNQSIMTTCDNWCLFERQVSINYVVSKA